MRNVIGKKPPRLACQAGVGLLETLIGATLLFGVGFFLFGFFSQEVKLQGKNRLRLEMLHTAQLLEDLINSPGTLMSNAKKAGNQALEKCLVGTNNNCRDEDKWLGFTLYNPADDSIISGKSTDPAYFDKRGLSCDTNCSFSVVTEFQPKCFPGQKQCKSAQLILVRYTIAETSTDPNVATRPLVQAVHEIDAGFSSIWTRINQKCPEGYGIRGISYAYEVRCENPEGDPGDPAEVVEE